MSNNPTELLYSRTHEWARLEGEEAVIGITWFAQKSLGDITYVELPRAGDRLTAGTEFGSVESVKAASDLISPVNGVVVAVNTALENAPETLNTAPFGDGWLARVKLADNPKDLMAAAAYEAFCAAEKH
ncbi:glycine cleavage system protein GcvH [Candidatus Desulfovibrio trichonymphae]|uniref:Glycine cleavage system H protein n=1 Tax=Candidatus Desulfovibrio trichonymphae TaxID=1725232 RepID=A0A1J1DP51_9BACT|nr:glycine cleavage system protein GcvH [Candidatus Desulfovibrio trichonymphae]BAV91609.1 glycine cleavage system H protein [Candidatus Desulfovibrio trichonymphae]GHU90910.1 glycine cleavage system H protein [Deltaproteobacteria bacterium]GHU98600.1 glycine cleavage system H protein [Deltaproteobacteria bacterium]